MGEGFSAHCVIVRRLRGAMSPVTVACPLSVNEDEDVIKSDADVPAWGEANVRLG